jgi:hypothetical protein
VTVTFNFINERTVYVIGWIYAVMSKKMVNIHVEFWYGNSLESFGRIILK